MRLRSRGYGPGFIFHPFKRLPTEVRQMIWRLTLEPRVVEVLCDSDRNNEGRYVRAYFSRARLPIALRISPDSRDAVLPLYPLCFGAETGRPKIRFNFSLDTLYLDDNMGLNLFKFFRSFNSVETDSLKKLAIADSIDLDHAFFEGKKYWQLIGESIKKLAEVKEVLIVIDAMCHLSRRYVLSNLDDTDIQIIEECDDEDPIERGVEIFEEFPKDLDRLVSKSNAKTMRIEIPDTKHKEDWVLKKGRVVWGLRRIKHDNAT